MPPEKDDKEAMRQVYEDKRDVLVPEPEGSRHLAVSSSSAAGDEGLNRLPVSTEDAE